MFRREEDDPHRYDDMLDLPHPTPTTRPRMSALDRAAQFAPFAALTGFGESITRAARQVERQIELGEAEKAELDRKLRVLRDRLAERPVLSVTYFVPDPYKVGGRYDTVTAPVRRLLDQEFALQLEDGREIHIDDIIDLQGAIFEGLKF